MLLKRGSRGDQVKWAQAGLNKAKPSQYANGFNIDQLAIDGLFGPRTDARTREFQAKHQLKVDGLIGPNTAAKIKIYYAATIPEDKHHDKQSADKSKTTDSELTKDDFKKLVEQELGRKISSLPREFESNLDTAFRYFKKANTGIKFGADAVRISGIVIEGIKDWGAANAALIDSSLAAGRVVAATPALGILAGFCGFIGGIMAFVNAKETNLRMYNCRAIAYSSTAWIFAEQPPAQSRTIMTRLLRTNFEDDYMIKEMHKAWRDSLLKTTTELNKWAEQTSRRYNTTPGPLRLALRANGGGNKRVLCKKFMDSFDSQFNQGINKSNWEESKLVLYPD